MFNHPFEIGLIVAISSFVLLIILIVLGLLYGTPRSTPIRRSQRASLPPLHCGYKPSQPENQSQATHVHPKAPKGRGGGSN